ncbi:SCP-like extracellular [Streptomyces sp. AcH 505]|uniref:CAP domain-containing protein n=1 Tax=unclassified Streptomyces TaxID=2593676 RepID=UPI0005918CF9|nr:CAP domain-containing protein [Streptomyces sp. NBC_00370]KIF67773.1 SCP-like extracellular [Streptomyces sp. AcH 505]
MGRHGRSAARPATVEEAGPAGRHRGGARQKRRIGPVRTGLLGASAAMAVGAVAVTSGMLPGGSQFVVGGSPTNGDQIRADGGPPTLLQNGGVQSPDQDERPSVSPSRGTGRSSAPEKTPSATPSKPAAKPTKAPKPSTAPPKATKTKPEETPSKAPAPRQTTERAVQAAPSAPSSTEAAVLSLVNEERAKVGCSPVRADASLGTLAQNFSDDMAARGFFDHTDPDGDTPWDRADKAGVEGLGGENIARGQADAQAVMDAWMNSEGHRANILNCDYTRLGVGVHTGSGGPWWTQDFGF